MPKSTTGAAIYSLLFLLAFVLSVVMLMTDTNLRTDFGAMPNGYYAHWYVVLVTAIVDLLGAILLLLVRSRTAVKAGTVGSGLLALIFLGDIFTYQQVGFANASAMANYLFGVTYYGHDIRYLYDVLLAVYLLTFVVGAALLWMGRSSAMPPARAWTHPDPTPQQPPP